MTATLRPMTLGEILDRTIQIYRSRFWVFAGIAACWAMAALLGENLGSVLIRAFPPLDDLNSAVFWLPRGWLEGYLSFLAWPAIAFVASQLLLGEKPSILSSFWWCAARWRSWAMLAVFFGAGLELPLALVNRLGVRLAYSDATTGILVVGSRLPGLWVFPILAAMRFACDALLNLAIIEAVPAWTLERLPLRAAFVRGWRISKGGRWRIFVAWLLSTALGYILTGAAVECSRLISNSVPAIADNGDLRLNFVMTAIRLAQIPVTPLFPIAITVIYYDQRVRQEGYDIELLMNAAGMDRPVDSPVEPASAPAAPRASDAS